MSTSYPTETPIAEITNIVSVLRSGNKDLAALAKDIWIVQGYAQSKVFGDPDSLKVMQVQTIAQNISNAASIELLESVIKADKSGKSEVIVKEDLSVPVALLLKWAIEELLKLIEAEVKG